MSIALGGSTLRATQSHAHWKLILRKWERDFISYFSPTFFTLWLWHFHHLLRDAVFPSHRIAVKWWIRKEGRRFSPRKHFLRHPAVWRTVWHGVQSILRGTGEVGGVGDTERDNRKDWSNSLGSHGLVWAAISARGQWVENWYMGKVK